MVLPETLQSKLDLFRVNGSLREGLDELFRNVSWQAVLEGMGVRPAGYHPLVDRIPFDGMLENLDRAVDMLNLAVDGVPSHQDFIRQHCAAEAPQRAPVRA
jgi:tryptophan halogenase